jgi:hypothetical protein
MDRYISGWCSEVTGDHVPAGERIVRVCNPDRALPAIGPTKLDLVNHHRAVGGGIVDPLREGRAHAPGYRPSPCPKPRRYSPTIAPEWIPAAPRLPALRRSPRARSRSRTLHQTGPPAHPTAIAGLQRNRARRCDERPLSLSPEQRKAAPERRLRDASRPCHQHRSPLRLQTSGVDRSIDRCADAAVGTGGGAPGMGSGSISRTPHCDGSTLTTSASTAYEAWSTSMCHVSGPLIVHVSQRAWWSTTTWGNAPVSVARPFTSLRCTWMKPVAPDDDTWSASSS